MNEKELLEIQKRIGDIVKESAKDPDAAIAALDGIRTEAAGAVEENSSEYYSVSIAVCEAKGDVFARNKKMAEAEKCYIEMIQNAEKMYQLDKEKYDYRLGYANFKRASFYRMILQCADLKNSPKVLNDQQQKLYTVTEGLYKNAIACTMANARKGMLRHAELHAVAMHELAVLYGAVGNYANAIACGKDGINIDKAIYEKKDDKVHCFRLANRMNTLAAIYTLMKNTQLTMEMIEDSIFVLGEHVEEDPVNLGYMLARNYLTVGGCYTQIEEEKENADEALKKGIKYLEDVNVRTENRMADELLNAYMMVGDHFRKKGNEMTAKSYYVWAMKVASDRFKETKDERYDKIMTNLKPLV